MRNCHAGRFHPFGTAPDGHDIARPQLSQGTQCMAGHGVKPAHCKCAHGGNEGAFFCMGAPVALRGFEGAGLALFMLFPAWAPWTEENECTCMGCSFLHGCCCCFLHTSMRSPPCTHAHIRPQAGVFRPVTAPVNGGDSYKEIAASMPTMGPRPSTTAPQTSLSPDSEGPVKETSSKE